ncbi:hypothetical protein [Mesorhizobium sp. 113-3-3]|uniref:hypothetical protein n=1 Tax=Mesorhizobium sp. 113-3-3 TaxID=2744516 RepID=UPI0019286D17|nr:hypothetical protein [Mesorhizobium sp. 113-3-3]BCG80083.1 hypothetical protein MesoLj113b_36250 [Mesorhizobium sp. 113-3-3]
MIKPISPEAAQRIQEYTSRIEAALSTPEAWKEFEEYGRQQFEAGEQRFLLEVIYWCSMWDKPLPLWARQAFVSAYLKVKTAEVGSLDDAFGAPYPKGIHLSKARQSNRRSQIFDRVNQIRESEKAPLDDGLFERVGREFNVGKTKCSRLYYEFESIDKQLRGGGLGFRQISKTAGN